MRYRCLACTSEEGAMKFGFCESCRRRLIDISYPRSCYEQNTSVVVSALYQHPISTLIKRAKEQGSSFWDEELRRFFSQWISHWAEVVKDLKFDAIVSVPGHPLRIHLETDLAAFIALELSRITKKSVISEALIRRRLAKEDFFFLNKNPNITERLHWRPFRFELPDERRRLPPGIRVLLVDDVMASGSTLRRCRELLGRQGIPVVASFVLSAARARM